MTTQPPAGERCWFACCTRPRHERVVAQLLGHKRLEHYLPLIPRVSRWSDRSKTIWWPAFPDYLFAYVSSAEFDQLRQTVGVRYIVSNGVRPSVIMEAEIENIRRTVSAIVKTGAVPTYQERELCDGQTTDAGDVVRVTEGPFEGIEGIVSDTRGGVRLLVTVGSLGHSIVLNIDRRVLRKVATTSSDSVLG